MDEDRLRRWAGGLSLAAGAVHGGVTAEHFEEWWGYGLFFVAAGAAQVLFGLALLTKAINEKEFGPGWRTWTRRLWWAGIWGNLAIMVLYAVTRSVGIPFFGPEAGEVEEVAPIDVLSKALELALVVLLWRLVRQDRRGHASQPEPV